WHPYPRRQLHRGVRLRPSGSARLYVAAVPWLRWRRHLCGALHLYEDYYVRPEPLQRVRPKTRGGDCHSQVGPSRDHATGGGWTPGRILYGNGNRKTASSISTVILPAVAGGPGTRVIRPWRSTSLPPPPSPRNWYLVPASSATTS